MYIVQVIRHNNEPERVKAKEVHFRKNGIWIAEIGNESCDLYIPYTSIRLISKCKDADEI